MSFEAYKIAVTISLVEHVSAGLASLSRHFARTDMDAAKLQTRLNAIGKMTLGGGLLAGAGVMGLKALHPLYDSAKKFEKAKTDFETLNLSAHENADVYAKAANISHKVLGTTLTGNVKLIQDLHTAFGDLHHALPMAESFAKFETTMKMAYGEHATEGLTNAGARALEHRGDRVTQNMEVFQDELKRMSQVSLFTKGMVNMKSYQAAAQTGKMAYNLADIDWLTGVGAGMMTTMSGDRLGTMMMTAFSSLIGGHMDGKGKNFASEIGIWEYGLSKKRLKEIRALENGMGPEEKRLFEKTLGNENLLHGGLKSEFVQMAVKRPDLFAAEIAKRIDSRYGTGASNALGVDAAQAKLAKGELTKEQYDKITKELKTDQVTAQALEVAKAFNRSTGMFYGDQLINATKYAKDAAGIKKSKDYETGLSAYQKTAVGNEVMLHAAWDNLKTTLGVTILPTMIAGINSLAKALDTIGAFFQRHPTLGKMLTHVASALSVMAVVGGGLMLFKAALTGLSLLNIAGIAGAIGGGTGLAGAMGLLLTPAGLAVAAIAAVTAAFWGISKLMALRDGSAAATTAGTLMRDKSALAGLNAKLANSAGLSELQRKGLLAQRSALEKQISSYADTAANKSARYGSMLTSDAGAGRGKSYAQPNTPTPITVVSNTYLDGAPLAKTVTKYQAREAQRGLHNSGSGYDSLRGTPSPAMGR